MLYTKKGDDGTTKLFNCPQGVRLSKSEKIFEALGTLDELNSAIGYAKVLAEKNSIIMYLESKKILYGIILGKLQQDLFCIQAELGGSDIHINQGHIIYIEQIIAEIETLLPPITSFIVSGGGETGAYLDITRAIARRAERQVILARNEKSGSIADLSIQYLNRLSSILYALARFANYQEGFSEEKPYYV